MRDFEDYQPQSRLKGRGQCLLQTMTAARTSRKGDEPSLELPAIRTQPALRSKFVWMFEDIGIAVRKVAAHFCNSLEEILNSQDTDSRMNTTSLHSRNEFSVYRRARLWTCLGRGHATPGPILSDSLITVVWLWSQRSPTIRHEQLAR